MKAKLETNSYQKRGFHHPHHDILAQARQRLGRCDEVIMEWIFSKEHGAISTSTRRTSFRNLQEAQSYAALRYLTPRSIAILKPWIWLFLTAKPPTSGFKAGLEQEYAGMILP